MFDVPQSEATPAAPAVEYAQAAPSDRPVVLISLPRSACGSSVDGEIVVCGRASNEQYRLRPLPLRESDAGFFQRPHVIKLAPNISIGLLGNGKAGARVDF